MKFKDCMKGLGVWLLLLVACLFAYGTCGSTAAAVAVFDPRRMKDFMGAGIPLAFAMGDISMFETRTMLQALAQMFVPNTAILDLFFKVKNAFSTEVVDVDIIKGGRKLAPFVSPLVEGKLVERTGYVTRHIQPPYIKQKMATTAADILKRQAGEIIYQGNMSSAARAQQQLGLDLLDLRYPITRREEWMAAQVLTTGKVICKGEGIDIQVDFQMAADHKITLTGDNLWSSANSNPPMKLLEWRRLLGKDSGLPGDTILMSPEALTAFLKHAETKAFADKLKINLGDMQPPRPLVNGLTYFGRMVNVDIYSYDEWYVDPDDGLTKPMIPANMIIMGSTQARCERLYGAIKDLKATVAADVFPKSWEEEDPSVRFLMLQSAPLPAPLQIDAFLYATVL